MKFLHRKRTGRKREKTKKGTYPATDTATEEDAGLPAYGTGILRVYGLIFAIVRYGRSKGGKTWADLTPIFRNPKGTG